MENYKIIGEDYFSKIDKKVLNKLVIEIGYSKELVFSHQEYSKFLQNYIILTYLPEKGIGIEEIYVSRYYWLKKFYHYYSIVNGKDMGIEQQINIILEEISNDIKNFDWNKILDINQFLKNGV